MAIFRTAIKVTIVTAALAGLVIVVAGPRRTAALFSRLTGKVQETIDAHIDEPTALRSQLRELEEQYPQRISEVRGDLAELTEQTRQIERDRAVADRVVALADRDLGALKPLLAQAESVRGQAGPGQVVSVRFDTAVLSVDEAAKRAGQITQTRLAYAARAADGERELKYLGQQSERLSALLTQLQNEREEFQSQIWQLDRQVDAIARNDRLIELMSRRQKTIEECGRYEAGSLNQLHAHLAEVRSKQEAELDMLGNSQQRLDYEDVARLQLQADEADGFGADAAGGAPGAGLPVIVAPGLSVDDGAGDPDAGDGSASAPVVRGSERGEVQVHAATPRPR